ncbi:unnamed protein product [Prorocentrum cordatum]|uniref:Uncharacterized protein n=1 Tax=Prorocentrum cordatum TaxID=2364126 RepID=A0ABN9YDH1_9DINO|nr:unnamed protein product [Polarella glacialis]
MTTTIRKNMTVQGLGLSFLLPLIDNIMNASLPNVTMMDSMQHRRPMQSREVLHDGRLPRISMPRVATPRGTIRATISSKKGTSRHLAMKTWTTTYLSAALNSARKHLTEEIRTIRSA